MSVAEAATTGAVIPKISLNLEEAGLAIGVSDETIRRAIHAGELKAKRSSKNDDGDGIGRLLIGVDDLRTWFNGLVDA